MSGTYSKGFLVKKSGILVTPDAPGPVLTVRYNAGTGSIVDGTGWLVVNPLGTGVYDIAGSGDIPAVIPYLPGTNVNIRVDVSVGGLPAVSMIDEFTVGAASPTVTLDASQPNLAASGIAQDSTVAKEANVQGHAADALAAYDSGGGVASANQVGAVPVLGAAAAMGILDGLQVTGLPEQGPGSTVLFIGTAVLGPTAIAHGIYAGNRPTLSDATGNVVLTFDGATWTLSVTNAGPYSGSWSFLSNDAAGTYQPVAPNVYPAITVARFPAAALTAGTAGIAAAVWSYLTSLITTAGSIGKFILGLTPVGPGGSSYTITVETTGGAPLQGVSTWITSDVAGGTVIAGPIQTNAAGQVTFMLPVGTFYVWRQLAGYTFTNPQAVTVI